jgi:hypothetical protein
VPIGYQTNLATFRLLTSPTLQKEMSVLNISNKWSKLKA